VVSSSVLSTKTVFNINAQGLENSVRNELDGITFFGNENDKEFLSNDFVFQTQMEEEKSKGRHFVIHFNPDNLKYYIKDLGLGTGTLLRIKTDTILKNNTLINIGESYFSVTFGNSDEEANNSADTSNMITIKACSGNTKYAPLNFQPSKTAIRIGRNPDCEVTINDNLLSRFHCYIEYNNIVGWIIKDGYTVKNKDIYEHCYSTNGTWMYLNDDFPIHEGMSFKAFQTLFECHLIDDK